MTDAVSKLTCSKPADNGLIVPINFPILLGWSDVQKIEINFPPGCNGLVGVQIQYASNPVYPISPGDFFVFDSRVLSLEVTNQRQGGQWRARIYNQDFNPHLIEIYFYYNYVTHNPGDAASSLVSLPGG